MPRIICKCNYLKGGTTNKVHLKHYVKYISTREGVENLNINIADNRLSPKQEVLIAQILKDFPLSKSIPEYQKYRENKNASNASEFINRALENNYFLAAKKKNYVDYISNRPGVEKLTTHGLFSNELNLNLAQISKDISNHQGNIWIPIISLKREDATKLGYDNAERWQNLLSSLSPQIADIMNIPFSDFKWYGAFHNEGSHPHVHMICYSLNPTKGFLSKSGLEKIKSVLAKEIFKQDLIEIYSKQTQARDSVAFKSRELMNTLIRDMKTQTEGSTKLNTMLLDLSSKLSSQKGKKVYGYLPKEIKRLVDDIVDEMQKNPDISKIYNLWYTQKEAIINIYKDDLPKREPLSQLKEFKHIKNIIIKSAVELSKILDVFPSEAGIPADSSFNPKADFDLLLENADKNNDAVSQYKLAKFYFQDSEKDIGKALYWLEKSANQKNTFALLALGKMYYWGNDIPADKEKAMFYFKEAAAQGNETANMYINNFDTFLKNILMQNTIQLFRNLGNIFKEKTPAQSNRGFPIATDKKLKRKIQAKREAVGFTRKHDHSM